MMRSPPFAPEIEARRGRAFCCWAWVTQRRPQDGCDRVQPAGFIFGDREPQWNRRAQPNRRERSVSDLLRPLQSCQRGSTPFSSIALHCCAPRGTSHHDDQMTPNDHAAPWEGSRTPVFTPWKPGGKLPHCNSSVPYAFGGSGAWWLPSVIIT